MPVARRLPAAVLTALAVLCLTPPPAQAGDGGGTGSPTGACSFPTVVINSQNVRSQISCSSKSTGGSQAAVTDWKPPTCWWEPSMTSAEFRQVYQTINKMMHIDNVPVEEIRQFGELYGPQLSNDDATGRWYSWVCNSNASTAEWSDTGIPGGWPWRWVNNGTPSVGGRTVLNTTVLAEIAASALRIPDTRVTLSPEPASQTVNLPTWIWVDAKTIPAQSATASLPRFNMSATVTAVPTRLDITVSGPDADASPSRLSCKVKPDGSIGTAWHAGAAGGSDCSLTFLRATVHARNSLTATLVWDVNFSAGGAGWPRHVQVSAPPQEITVKEIQTVVTG
ncbi:hypothetical protein [Kitasatospora sp. KL5]|uniref:hypothetical protein n=1 Tax=Kitasatospora sp. KL5 TaxID=3425125 RepID=UPI003D6F6C0F